MGSGAITCIPNFIKTGSAIQKLIRGYTDTQTAWEVECQILQKIRKPY
jgi:hypothetical protein